MKTSNLRCKKSSETTFLRIRPGGRAPTKLRSDSGNDALRWCANCLMLD